MAKITGIYKIVLPSIPINADEVSKQIPITIKKDKKLIKIYPPGYDCEKIWNNIKGPNKQPVIHLSQGKTPLADFLDIFIEKDVCLNKGDDIDPEYKDLDTEIEDITYRIMKLLREKLPKTIINIPNHLQYNSAYQLKMENQKTRYLGRASKGYKVSYSSSTYCLDVEKWEALKRAVENNEGTEIWRDFLYDAKVSLIDGELSKAILFVTIGYEIFIKEYTEKSVKNAGISACFWEYLKSRQPRVLDYYDAILHLITGHSLKTENQDLYKMLERLNSARNNIVHEGKISFPASKIKQLRTDINNIDQVISWVNSL